VAGVTGAEVAVEAVVVVKVEVVKVVVVAAEAAAVGGPEAVQVQVLLELYQLALAHLQEVGILQQLTVMGEEKFQLFPLALFSLGVHKEEGQEAMFSVLARTVVDTLDLQTIEV